MFLGKGRGLLWYKHHILPHQKLCSLCPRVEEIPDTATKPVFLIPSKIFRLMLCSRRQVGVELHECLVLLYIPRADKSAWQIMRSPNGKPARFRGRACRLDRMSLAMTLFRQLNPTLNAYLQPELSNPAWAPSASTWKAKEQSTTAGSEWKTV